MLELLLLLLAELSFHISQHLRGDKRFRFPRLLVYVPFYSQLNATDLFGCSVEHWESPSDWKNTPERRCATFLWTLQ